MDVVPAAERRVTTTPNATMRTLASPTLGHAASSLWLVEMGPGAQGPVHAFAGEVLWAVTDGAATVHVGGRRVDLGPGDTAVLPGGELRRFVAGPDGFRAVATTGAPGTVTREDGADAGVPGWVV